jgi:hypothetical protein
MISSKFFILSPTRTQKMLWEYSQNPQSMEDLLAASLYGREHHTLTQSLGLLLFIKPLMPSWDPSS